MMRHIIENLQRFNGLAIIENKKEISYTDLINKTYLIQQHLPRDTDQIIAIYLPNSSDYISSLLAIITSDLTVFPMNPSMTSHEIIALLQQASINTLITATAFKALFEDNIVSYIPNLHIIYIDALQSLNSNYFHSEYSVSPNDPMVLINTSGTTGKAKIVQLSETNIETAVFGYLKKMDFDQQALPNIRLILATPFTSAYGLMLIFACLIKSFTIIILKDGFTLDYFYATVEKYKATHYEGGTVPILLMEQTIGRSIRHDIRSLKYFGFGGSKVSGATIQNLIRSNPDIKLSQGYGMTEASPLISKNDLSILNKLDSVGTPIDQVEIAVEIDGNITHVPYKEGQIVVKGPNIMIGYYKNEEETNKVIINNYLYTGDIGYLDDEGYLYICGRKKNVIIVRGMNVYPEEIESCLLNSLLITDCYVYGESDSLGNEVVYVDVIPINETIQYSDISNYCHDHLSNYKCPKIINFCNSIKKNASGKIERFKNIPL